MKSPALSQYDLDARVMMSNFAYSALRHLIQSEHAQDKFDAIKEVGKDDEDMGVLYYSGVGGAKLVWGSVAPYGGHRYMLKESFPYPKAVQQVFGWYLNEPDADVVIAYDTKDMAEDIIQLACSSDRPDGVKIYDTSADGSGIINMKVNVRFCEGFEYRNN